ncbi:MAG TPA: hypothetical protein VGV35_06920 [Bryobacteraceae bacterium]|nr:hypothetical protein [Bryobacteraceae bacterium]
MSTTAMTMNTDTQRQLLRHTVATLAYRAGKALRGAPEGVAGFHAGADTRTPVEILAHMGDLFDWALSMAKGKQTWHDSTPLGWDPEVTRFFAALEAFDAYLASSEPLHVPTEKLFQGAIADALTHTGQINILRRLAGAPVRGEDYAMANITAGRAGSDQAAPVKEF